MQMLYQAMVIGGKNMSRESNNVSDDIAKFLLIVGKAEAGS